MLERNNGLGRTQVYHWFDESGNEIGKTELTVSREDAGSNQALVVVVPQGMIIMNDGLWVLNDLRIRNDEDVRKEMDSKDDSLYKVPVPNEGR